MAVLPPRSPADSGVSDLTRGSVRDHLVRLSVPMVWGILSILSFQLADMFFISLLGTRALAAFTFTFPVTMLVFYLVMALGISTSSVISRLAGTGAHKKASRIVTHGVLIALLLGGVIALLGISVMEPVFTVMGAESAMIPAITDYMHIWLIGNIFITVPLVGNAAMRAYGDSRTPALIMLFVAALNVALDPVLIFGWFGFPAMGIQGAAVATAVANLCACALSLYVLRIKNRVLFRRGLRWRLLGDSLGRLSRIALPVGLASIIAPGCTAVLIALLAGTPQGQEAVAAFGIVSRVEAFAFVILMAVATGMAPIVGQNWGAGRLDRVRETIRLALSFGVFWSLGVAVLLAIFARPLAQVFSQDPDVIAVAALYFWIIPASAILGNLVNGWSSVLNATGQPFKGLLMVVIRLIALQIPLAILGSIWWGAVGVFAAIALANILSGAAFHMLNARAFREGGRGGSRSVF